MLLTNLTWRFEDSNDFHAFIFPINHFVQQFDKLLLVLKC